MAKRSAQKRKTKARKARQRAVPRRLERFRIPDDPTGLIVPAMMRVMFAPRRHRRPVQCPTCGEPVASVFDHVDGCKPAP